MFIRSKIKVTVSALLLGALMLFSLVVPAFAVSDEPATTENTSQATLQEVYFVADCPPDFEQMIVITATSLDTGYIHSYYLHSKANYQGYFRMPHGRYSISASASSTDGSTDGTVYIVKPATDTFVVENVTYIPALSLVVEGYTNTDPEQGLPGENNPSTDEPGADDPTLPDDPELSNPFEEEEDWPKDDQSPDNSTDAPVKQDASGIIKSLIFSALAILIFYICGYIYRRYKEG